MNIVWDLKVARVRRSILMFFGKQYRFEIKHPSNSAGAR